MKTISDVCYTPEGMLLDIHIPESHTNAVFVYFHGGGLEVGSKDPNSYFIKYLTEKNIAFVDVNYRMYPNAKYPEFIEDAAEAVSWTFQHIKEYVDCDKIFVGGSSAGGYLSMMLCFDEKYLKQYGIKTTDIAGYVHDAGQPTTHFNILRERGIDTRRVIIDESAPLYHIGANGHESSPMIFFVSDQDLKGRYEQTMMTLCTLEHFEYDMSKIKSKVINGTHCRYLSALDSQGESVFGKMVYEFISENL